MEVGIPPESAQLQPVEFVCAEDEHVGGSGVIQFCPCLNAL
jgi:hypothetical protein